MDVKVDLVRRGNALQTSRFTFKSHQLDLIGQLFAFRFFPAFRQASFDLRKEQSRLE